MMRIGVGFVMSWWKLGRFTDESVASLEELPHPRNPQPAWTAGFFSSLEKTQLLACEF